MPRPVWSGAISFGLVNVPVKLFTAVRHKEVRFHMLHDKDGGRIRFKRVCELDGEEVPYEHIAKGYEISKGRNIMISKEELEALAPRATKSIDIEDFVGLDDVDPIYFESTYYLMPDKGANRPYALLLEAMKRTRRVGVARMVLRTREYLCLVRPYGDALAVSTMSWADELVSLDDFEELPGAQAKPRERELQMAEQLIESLSAEFEPDKYKDMYREQVLELLARKAEGEEIRAAPEAPAPGKVIDLMQALQASLRASRKGGADAANDEQAPSHGARGRPADEPRAAARTVRARSRSTTKKKKKKSASASPRAKRSGSRAKGSAAKRSPARKRHG